ncbi:hypothetical protein PYW07_003481 [Mythimna separata]|uniref:Cilia- and flagella-associated protein 157 n=1 Tax=Mythimna separata TaxID=271217 RepID=A0AAD7YIP4_MYTSE|nr:hypothetical protein PYW07_003481 [Mythimna separata]
MAPKKSEIVPVFSKVEKAFYELQLADCNKKLARLRTVVDDYEVRYEELQKAYDQLDKDRADVISYLNKTLTAKTEENAELIEKFKNSEELRVKETTKFHETVTELEKNFTRMKDQLTSENKLLAGKLNALEEFRAIRDDLMKKLDEQKRVYIDQEMKYKRIIYNTEKKIVVGKDKLKKEMEGRLVQLAEQFQDINELKIAASTHRVIRENIALNHQIDNLLMTQMKVSQENDMFREQVRASRCAMEVAEEERDKAINKSIVQLKVIDQLTAAFDNVKKQKTLYNKEDFNTEKSQMTMQKLIKENESLLLRVRILEQNLHATLGDQNKSEVVTAKLLQEHEKFKNILKESSYVVQGALKLENWSTLDPSREILNREVVLKRILDVINQYRDSNHAESMESFVSLGKMYEKGEAFETQKSLVREVTPTSQHSFENKRDSIPVSSEPSATESLKTIPSVKLLSLDEEGYLPTPKDSLPSFTVASLNSGVSPDTPEETDMTEMLEKSRMKAQKSLMADLALSSSGQAVELAACECAARPWAGDSSMVVAEVGAGCRCGCVLHLAPAARLLAGSARACPSRSFWLLQAEEGLVVRLRMEAVRLPCAGQSLRARDGDSLGSPLLASWDGPDSTAVTSGDVETTTDGSGVVEIAGGRHILVELRSGDTSDRCAGGFLAHATQMEPIRNASAAWASVSGGMWWRTGGGAREAAVALAAAAALAALCLALHSAHRTRAYQRAADKESLTDSDAETSNSVYGAGVREAAVALAAAAALAALCLALHLAHRTRAYQRAADKESLTDSDACSASLELGGAPSGSRSTLLSEVVGGGVSLRRLLPSGKTRHTRLRDSDRSSENVEQRDEEDPITDNEADPGDSTSVVSADSVASQATVTPETVSSSSAPVTGNIPPSPLRRSHTVSVTNVTVQQVSSPPQSTTGSLVVEMSTSMSSASERDSCSEKDRDSMWDKDRSESRASSSTSAATLTNGWYSPALSGVSAARIRDNPKHTKESCNRRLLKSDLSLTSHPEMEIDYYDYEVNNAVPGSYLGMDPAFLVWIPPLEEGDILKEIDENKVPIYEEILPKELHPDPGSNTESPEDRPTSSTLKRNPDNRLNRSNESIKSFRKVIEKGNIIHPLNFSITDLQNSPKMSKRNKKKKAESPVTIQMKDLTLTRSPVRVHRKENRSDFDTSTLKRVNETKEKDADTLKRNDFADIRFADENSDSSNDIKFADDSPDSNRIVDNYNVKA